MMLLLLLLTIMNGSYLPHLAHQQSVPESGGIQFFDYKFCHIMTHLLYFISCMGQSGVSPPLVPELNQAQIDFFDLIHDCQERSDAYQQAEWPHMLQDPHDTKQLPSLTRVSRKKSGCHPGQEGYRFFDQESDEDDIGGDQFFNEPLDQEEPPQPFEVRRIEPEPQVPANDPVVNPQRNYPKYFMRKMFKDLRSSVYARERLQYECTTRGISVARVIGLMKCLTDIRGPPSLAILKKYVKPRRRDSYEQGRAKEAFAAYLEVFVSSSFERMVNQSRIRSKRSFLEYGYQFLRNILHGTPS